MLKCISLDQATVSLSMCDHQRMSINCLLSNDLELRFLGTIFCEMDDFDQTPAEQSLIYLWDLEKQTVGEHICISEKTFDCLEL